MSYQSSERERIGNYGQTDGSGTLTDVIETGGEAGVAGSLVMLAMLWAALKLLKHR